MKNCNAPENQSTRRILLIACAIAAVVFTVSLPQPAHADDPVTPPPVPPIIEVPEGNEAFLVGYAVGTQNYICLPCPNVITPAAMCPVSGLAWGFFGPQATLFDEDDKQIITHFLSPNLGPIPPEVAGTARATWQHSKDTSTVWAKALAVATSASDPDFVQAGAIPWLLLEVVGDQDEPTGSHKLTATTFIQRVNTSGGVAPATGCTLPADVGMKALVPYTTDYFFYKAAESDADDD